MNCQALDRGRRQRLSLPERTVARIRSSGREMSRRRRDCVPVAPIYSLFARRGLDLPTMLRPSSPSGTLPPWSRLPLAPLAALWATLWILVAIIENSHYIHGPSIPRWQPLTLILSLTCTIVLWLTFELRTPRYMQFPLEPPGPWFLYQLRRLPILARGYIVIVFGIRH